MQDSFQTRAITLSILRETLNLDNASFPSSSEETKKHQITQGGYLVKYLNDRCIVSDDNVFYYDSEQEITRSCRRVDDQLYIFTAKIMLKEEIFEIIDVLLICLCDPDSFLDEG